MVASIISSILVCLAALVAVDAAPSKRADALPDFVLKYAPLTYLYSGEKYWPSDIKVHLTKVDPQIDFKSVGDTPTLQTLSSLSPNVSLTVGGTEDLLAHKSEFFTSTVGKPDSSGLSAAPATIIVVEKPGGIVDAFYFYFYSWDLGNT